MQEQHFVHRGIQFTVEALSDELWQWSIDPPTSVNGLTKVHGLSMLGKHDAIEAAKPAIDKQDFRMN